MQTLVDILLAFLDFLHMLISFPLWLVENVPHMLLVVNDAINALPDFLTPIAFLGVSLIVLMGVVKIL